MEVIKHENNGKCLKCAQIFDKFPGFDSVLRSWFSIIQEMVPEFHACDAGRGHIDQEHYFQKGASKAHWGESAHNYNCAFDSFFLVNGSYCVSDEWYEKIEDEIPSFVEWYGRKGAPFFEKPHFERKGWRGLLASGHVQLVEIVNAA